MRLYLIRHWEGLGNQEKFLQGTDDIALSPRWLQQSALLWARLSRVPFDVLYTSPLSRAQQTADAIIAQQDGLVEKYIDERLTGRYYGPYQGKPYSVLTWPDHQTLERLYKMADGKEGIESRDAVAERGYALMQEILEHYVWKRVALVTHNEVKAALIQKLIHPDMPNDYSETSVSILEYRDGIWDYSSLNDISHLQRDDERE
jgi:broad specificity phosphatase PhoE